MLDVAALMKTAPLGDGRLNKRAQTLVTGIIQGQASATHGPQGVGHQRPWSHAMGAFRFFDNDRLQLPALYEPCRAALRELVAPGQRCYVMHDVSVVDYSGHQGKQDLIPVGNDKGYGYELFSSLVVSEQGRPLGPVMQEIRTMRGLLSSESPTPLPFVDHMTQVERAVEAIKRCLPQREMVQVADREFDELQLLRFIEGQQGLYLIRAQHLGRWIKWSAEPTRLKQVVSQLVLVRAARIQREGKEYDLFVGETQVVFDGKSFRGVAQGRHKPQPGSPIGVRLVVSELRSPGHKPLQWVLLTNLQDPLLDVVQAYVWRWRIERFFFLNKVGLRLEQWQQENGERIARRLAISQLAAMAIYQMQAAAESDPEMGQLIKLVATLGGWLGRKQDPIGPIVMMRGMLLVLGWVTAVEEFGEEKLRTVAQKLRRLVGLPTRT
jgi:hypothetical protein